MIEEAFAKGGVWWARTLLLGGKKVGEWADAQLDRWEMPKYVWGSAAKSMRKPRCVEEGRVEGVWAACRQETIQGR